MRAVLGSPYDGAFLSVDSKTNALKDICIEESKINDGDHYFTSDYSLAVADEGTVEFIIEVPDTSVKINLTFSVWSTAGATVDFYSEPTTISGGTTVSLLNSDFGSSNTSDVVVTKDPSSIGGDGTKLFGIVASIPREGGLKNNGRKIILDPGATYLLRITATAGTNDISWDIGCSEHTDEN